MAPARTTYPYLPAKAWWALRKKFRQSIPPQVTPSYLVLVLGGKESTAKWNILPPLKAMGLVADGGAPTDRAKLWRDDASYSEVCSLIRSELYPPELLDAIPGPEIDKVSAERWFMTKTGCGEQAAGKMAAMFALLTTGDPSLGDATTGRKQKKRTQAAAKKRPATKPGDGARQGSGNHRQGPPHDPLAPPSLEMPEMRLNLEIRIDASVTPEQIDQIFLSMAKHLYHRDDEGK